MEQLRKSIDRLNLGSRFHVQLQTLTREGLESAIKRMFENDRKRTIYDDSERASEETEVIKTPLNNNGKINHCSRAGTPDLIKTALSHRT